MLIKEILPLSRIELDLNLHSKKAVLERLSVMLSADCADLTELEVFDAFLSRERLGSTGLGNGIAIPHGRMAEISETKGAFLKIKAGIDFDAVDNQRVDMFFALLVPDESTDEHLKVLAHLAEMFSQEDFLQELRAQKDPEKTFEMLISG